MRYGRSTDGARVTPSLPGQQSSGPHKRSVIRLAHRRKFTVTKVQLVLRFPPPAARRPALRHVVPWPRATPTPAVTGPLRKATAARTAGSAHGPVRSRGHGAVGGGGPDPAAVPRRARRAGT